MSQPLVAIVGAPNVGKSTLFNRLVGGRRAIVTNEPGVTRDRLYGTVRRAGLHFDLVDTGGQTPNTAAPFAREIEQQADAALADAKLVLYVVDVRAGLTATDQELAPRIRQRGLPTILVGNKADTDSQEMDALDLNRLGLGQPLTVSAEHGKGVDELLDEIGRLLGESGLDREDEEETEALPRADRPIRVAIVGRPNVGKSSIVNRLLGEERVMVSDISGTTRDAIDTFLEVDGRKYTLIDTAGMRRRGKVEAGVERFSVQRAMQNLSRADVALLVIDGSDELAAQDTHVAGFVVEAFRPLVVVVNKWDLVTDRENAFKEWEEKVRYRLRFAKQVPFRFVSALTGQRILKILDEVDIQYRLAGKEISTADLNRWLDKIKGVGTQSPSQGRGFRLFYATQTGVHPPRFRIFCNDPKRLHFSRKRFLENSLRDTFGFGGAPIRLDLRKRRPGRADQDAP